MNDRWLSDDYLATVFPKSEAIAKLMDRTGYDTFWLAEHHFQREGYECIPNVLMLALHLCHVTKNIRIGCGFNIAPMWHPIRMAEDYATADWLTNGRVVFGVGPRLPHPRGREPSGRRCSTRTPTASCSRSRSRSSSSRSTSAPSRTRASTTRSRRPCPIAGYELREITLVPRPKTLPVECWQPVVSASPRALDFMAKHGIKGIIGGGAAPGGASEKVVHAFREARARAGRESRAGRGPLHRLLVPHRRQRRAGHQGGHAVLRGEHQDVRAARLRARPHARADRGGRPTRKRARQANLPTLRHAVKAGTWLIGPPELITEQLMEIQHKYPGLEVVNVGQPVGTPQAVILEQLERFRRR